MKPGLHAAQDRGPAIPMLPDPLGGRSLPEWIGSSPDAKVPDRVRERVFLRAGGICHISGRRIAAGEPWQLEHAKPLSMGGEHRESNLRPALAEPHKEKSAEEADQRSKADRVRRKLVTGTWPKSPYPLKSRNTFRSRWIVPTRPASMEDAE